MSIYQGPNAAPKSTLVDIFRNTAALHQEAIAIESGNTQVSYRSLLLRAEKLAKKLNRKGVGNGDRVTIQLETGGAQLYETILGVLFSGAAYVPVDFEDSEKRLEHITEVSNASAHISSNGLKIHRKGPPKWSSTSPDSDAWVIFTSGSTGVPKAVAVSHRSASNLVLAEHELFLHDLPLSPGARVAATLSPAFDASIEEMWLAWSTGATLVPIDRKTLTSGPDLATALRDWRIDALSTLPTIARFLVGQNLGNLRLLILGGEAVTPDLVEGLFSSNLELWNTYGPTEATIIASATKLSPGEPITIGHPIAGVDLAVIDELGHLVPVGETGQLVISGIGLARYLNSKLDAERFRGLPSLGWDRAYYTGDFVRVTMHGLEFIGRIDEQVKVGGKRIDLAEVESAALKIQGVSAVAAVARQSSPGDYSINCFLTVGEGFKNEVFRGEFQRLLPAGIRPSVHVISELPLKTSGKIDKNRLAQLASESVREAEVTSFVGGKFAQVLGLNAVGDDENFFELGGTSIKVAQLLVELRQVYETATVADIYRHPTPGDLEESLKLRKNASPEAVLEAQGKQKGAWARIPVALLLQWITGVVVGGGVLVSFGALQKNSDYSIVFLFVLLAIIVASGPGRATIAGALIRLVTLGIKTGRYRRNGLLHHRIWLAERLADVFSVSELVGTPWMIAFARITGSTIQAGCSLESMPPLLGNLFLGANSTIGRDVHLSGWTVQGDEIIVAGFSFGSSVRVGNRSFINEGVRVGSDVEIDAGTLVDRDLANGSRVTGSPLEETDGTSWPDQAPAQSRAWSLAYLVSPSVLGILNLVQVLPTVLYFSYLSLGKTVEVAELVLGLILLGPVNLVVNASVSACVIRFASSFVVPGFYPVNSREGYFSWLVERQLQRTRRQSFWVYASVITPLWARLLGAQVGRNCEISTFNGQIGLVTIGDECFIADDASLAPREIKNGWVRLGGASLERRSFVGNSGLVRQGVTVRSGSLIGVASEAPSGSVANSSFFGLPPIEFPRRQLEGSETLRYSPTLALRARRFSVEIFRLSTGSVSVTLFVLIYLLAGAAPQDGQGFAMWLLYTGLLYVGASYAACLITVAMKWLLVGRVKRSDHDLWTGFVWRNELVWNFVESLAMPWASSVALETPIHNHLFRLLGAKIGKNASVSTWFLDDPDLITVGENSSLLKSSDLQTHLFHDRLMQLAPVHVGANTTIGGGTFLLPGSSVGNHTQISAGSLVARDENVPGHSKLSGNPVEHR